MTKRKVLVAGATGVVGRSAIEAFSVAGWEVHGCSRTLPFQAYPGVRYHSTELLDPASCATLVEAIGDIDELAYCAINEVPGSLIEKWTDREQVQRNALMFSQLLDAILHRPQRLRHVSIIHGTKAYAVHLRDHEPLVPLRESQPRRDHNNFYFEQEDEVARRSQGEGWSWTVFRAPAILGGGIGSNLSVFLAFGVLASVARIQGERLDFPGVEHGGVLQVVDSSLIGRAFVWAADCNAAGHQIFNISNGEVAQWRSLWPVIAEANGIAVGQHTPGASCVEAARRIAPVWASIAARHNLAAPADLGQFLGESFALADFTLSSRVIGIMSTVKLRKAGFADCEDTPERIYAWYERWRKEKLLPPL